MIYSIMVMSDLEIAKNALKAKNLALAIAKNGKLIFESNSHGVLGLFEAIEKLGDSLEGASVADKVVGKAAALLCAYSRVSAVYASILSFGGKDTLEKNNIRYEYNILVSAVLDRTGREMCPFEKFSLSLENPEEAYFRLKEFAEKIRSEA